MEYIFIFVFIYLEKCNGLVIGYLGFSWTNGIYFYFAIYVFWKNVMVFVISSFWNNWIYIFISIFINLEKCSGFSNKLFGFFYAQMEEIFILVFIYIWNNVMVFVWGSLGNNWIDFYIFWKNVMVLVNRLFGFYMN